MSAITDDEPVLTSLSLTHVQYNPADPLSQASAFLSLLPQALVIVYTTLIFSTREFEVLFMFAGQMGCEGLNYVLKRVIKEDRPMQLHGKGYGMPSSHAQFTTYWAVYLTLFLLVRYNPPTPTANSPPTLSTSYLARAGTATLGLGVAYAMTASRVYLNYHTPRQVLVGAIAGTACAVTWFVMGSIARSAGLVDYILDMRIARAFKLRDLVVSADLWDMGWTQWQERKRLRKRD